MYNQELDLDHDINFLNMLSGDSSLEYNYRDYFKFEFEEMVELIKGKVFDNSESQNLKHHHVRLNLCMEIQTYLKGKLPQMFHGPVDVVLPIGNFKREFAKTVVQPDILVILDKTIIERDAIFGVPNWIIEILSPATAPKDRGVKYDVYEEAGVGEYWIVSPEYETVEVFLLENEKYSKKYVLDKNEKVKPFTLPDLEIDLKEIFN